MKSQQNKMSCGVFFLPVISAFHRVGDPQHQATQQQQKIFFLSSFSSTIRGADKRADSWRICVQRLARSGPDTLRATYTSRGRASSAWLPSRDRQMWERPQQLRTDGGGAVRGRTGQSGDGSPGDKEEEKWTGGITREQRRL